MRIDAALRQFLKQAHCIFSSTTPDDAMQQRLDDLKRLVVARFGS